MRINLGPKFLAPATVLTVTLILAPEATPDVWNKLTNVRFGEPVEFPGGVVVPAGSYVLKLADSSSNRNIVQVFNPDQDHIYATVLAIPTQRSQPAEKTIITFHETPGGDPAFIHKWFYPGDTVGREFPYLKHRTRYLARAASRSGPAASESRGSAAPAAATAPVAASAPESAAPAPEPEPALEPEPAPAPAPAAAAGPAEPAGRTADTPKPAEPAEAPGEANLPKTASDTPELALAGVVLLLMGLGMTVARRAGLGKRMQPSKGR